MTVKRDPPKSTVERASIRTAAWRILGHRGHDHSREVDRGDHVLTPAFGIVLALTFLGFAFEQTLRPVIPLVIIDRGGSALLVGLVTATHALPALLFRPFIGRLIDGGHHLQVLRFGALTATLAPIGVLLPGIAALASVRFLQGSSWALYAVSTRTLMARLAPAHRRGEASGYFALMPAFATLLGPAVGIALYLTVGEVGPVLVAMALGLVAFGIAQRVRIPADPGGSQPLSVGRPAPASRMVEPSALPPTAMITTFLAGQTLFTVFPPLYVFSIGASVESLAIYYPAYGIVMVLSQLVAGRVSDRVGRGGATRIGCSLAIAGLATAALGDQMWTFTVGAVGYAVAVSIVVPTMSAMAIDRAPATRLGAAMATYSIGYQMAIGVSSLAWGAILSIAGFPWAFITAIALQLVTIAASVRYAARS